MAAKCVENSPVLEIHERGKQPTGVPMLRRAAFLFPLVLTAFRVAAGQPGPAPIIVTPGSSSMNLPSPKLPDAQQPPPDNTPHLKPVDLDNRQSLSDGTKMQLIRVMDAEFVHVRKNFPVGDK